MGRRRPLTAFLLLAYGIGWPALMVPVVTDLPAEPFLLVLLFLALLGPALLVTRWVDGPGAIRRLLGRTLLWRFGIGRWAVVLLAMPVLTLGLAAGSGTLESPERGWVIEVGLYLFSTLIFGALVGNLWEETAWGGFVQTRLMARHGLLVGSLLTAPLFAAIHVPLQLGDGASWSESAVRHPRRVRDRPVLPLPAGHAPDGHRRQHPRDRRPARRLERVGQPRGRRG